MDQIFWKAYAKFAAIVVAGFGLSILLGVPVELATRLCAGAVLTFIVAFKVAREGLPE
jgi:hypothetical protein